MVTLGAAERDKFWTEVERIEVKRTAIPLTKRGATWVPPQLRLGARHLGGEEKLRHATSGSLRIRKAPETRLSRYIQQCSGFFE